jgi:hypothetical protein
MSGEKHDLDFQIFRLLSAYHDLIHGSPEEQSHAG